MSSGSGTGKWALVVVIVIAAGLGGFYAGRPELFRGIIGSLGGRAVPELAASHLKVGYIDLSRDSYASIDQAVDNFEKAMALAPDYPAAMAALCEAHLARGEYLEEEAEDLAAEVVGEKKVDREKLEKRIADLRRRAERRRDEAFRYGSQAIKLEPGSLAVNRAMADYYRVTRASEQMRDLLTRAEAVDRDDPGIAYVRGSAAAEDPAAAERAIRYLDTALERAPRMQRARYKLARVYYRQGEADAARVHLQAVLDAVPDHERAKGLLASLKTPPPEPEPAEPEVEEPDPEAPSRPAGQRNREAAGFGSLDRLINRAERLRRADLPTRALPVYFEALDIEPSEVRALNGIGWCYIDLEQPTTAISYFNRARTILSDSAEAHIGLAEAYKAKGMKRDAVRYYRRYLELEPYGSEAAVARRMLEQLQ